MNAMFEYAKDVGRDHVDIDALAEALADVAAAYRSAGEIAGYGLESMIAWALEQSPEHSPAPHRARQHVSHARPVTVVVEIVVEIVDA